MKQLIQKTLTSKKSVHIEAEGVFIQDKSLLEDLDYKIKFEELGFDIVRKRSKNANIAFYFFVLFDILYTVLLVISVVDRDPFKQQLFWVFALLLFAGITIAAYFNKNKSTTYLTGGQKILVLLSANPNVEMVNIFIDEIHQAMRFYLKKKFSTFDFDTPYEQKVSQLKWLREMKIITEEEYKELLDDTKINNIIGFGRQGSDY